MIICCEFTEEEYTELKTLARKQKKDLKTLFHDLLIDYIDQKLHCEFSFL